MADDSAAVPGDITRWLKNWSGGDSGAFSALAPLVYDQLRQIARQRLSGERGDHTLQPTALVNEAFLVLVRERGIDWQNRAHFFALASRLMRRILIDHANWMGRGEVITNALVEDASANGDWSAVRVWNVEAATLGGRAYPVLGFVLPDQQ